MRHNRPRLAALCLSAALLLPLSACAVPTESTDPPETAATDLRAHFDALARAMREELAALREELAALRTDAHVTEEALLARIEALEAALAAPDADLPTMADPTPPETDAATEALPPPSADPIPDAETADGFRYILENGSATVVGLASDAVPARLILPDTLDGYPVTRIADNAFAGLPLESVTLPATLTAIGWFAFADCERLSAVTVPASVARIGYGAFDHCPRVTLYCPRGSYAARYASASAIPYTEV